MDLIYLPKLREIKRLVVLLCELGLTNVQRSTSSVPTSEATVLLRLTRSSMVDALPLIGPPDIFNHRYSLFSLGLWTENAASKLFFPMIQKVNRLIEHGELFERGESVT